MGRGCGHLVEHLGSRLTCLVGCLGSWFSCDHLDGLLVWLLPKKFLRFLISQELFYAKLIETHSGSFYRIIWLDAGTFSNKISYRPANKLKWTREQAQGHCPVCLYSDSQHWFRSQFSEFPVTTSFTFILQKLHSYMIEAPPRQGLY